MVTGWYTLPRKRPLEFPPESLSCLVESGSAGKFTEESATAGVLLEADTVIPRESGPNES